MFKTTFKMAKNYGTENSPIINFLGAGTSISGDIISNGDFRIDGNLKGSIKSKGKVVVGNSGKIEGEIICQNADISGEIIAKIVVHELLSLKSSAKLQGDIFTNKLAIEPGAKFTGTCNMNEIPNPGLKSVLTDEKNQQKAAAVK
jgi:cytoskeletal protein CcmA (bactofilin family)